MKFRVLCAIALCICLGQLCSASNEFAEKRIKKIKDDLQNKIHGVGVQFVEDITTILDHTPSNPHFIEMLHDLLTSTLDYISQKQGNTKFSVSGMEDFHSMKTIQTKPDYHTSLQLIDYYKILQLTLSKQFPPERYNGIINMFYINVSPNATSEEIANTLNYLDGTDNAARKVSYLELYNFPDPIASDYPDHYRYYSEAVDKLKSMIDIRPKVFEDFAAIQEKFPCNTKVNEWQQSFVSTIAGLHGDKSKLNACVQLPEGAQMTKDQFDYFAREMESILSLRLPDDTYRGLLNIIKAYQTRTPKNEIKNSLEYLYGDVPRADCSS